jgi:cysteine-rich repeat protein
MARKLLNGTVVTRISVQQGAMMNSVRGAFNLGSLAFMVVIGAVACGSDSSSPGGVDGGGGGGTDGGTTPMSSVDGGGVDAPAADVDCAVAAPGTACGADGYCVAGACETSRCGDKIVDIRVGEECEDSNDISGDGCTQCRFDCSASTACDDANACNGAETCDTLTHTCKPGVVAVNLACTITGGGAGTCKAGTCVLASCGDGKVDVGEQCDDKTAGCTKECKFTCTSDRDCNDANLCDGVETCALATHTCKAGTPKACNANGCTGTCEPETGNCGYADTDKDGSACNLDCNDVDPATFPGGFECKDGKDNDCSVATVDVSAPGCECYIDSDRDGFASVVTGAIASPGVCPAGYTRTRPIDGSTTDCGPRNASAFPGQSKYFPTSYCPGGVNCLAGTGSFDYNCDTKEDSSYFDGKLGPVSCAGFVTNRGCTNATGWVTTVPACGKPGTYRTCSWNEVTGCSGIDTANRLRPCR